MPTFAYSGRTRGGQTVSGERMADTVDAAVAALRRDQVLVTRIEAVKAKASSKIKAKGKGVPARNLAIFTRQFSVMIDAGLPLVQCLDILESRKRIRISPPSSCKRVVMSRAVPDWPMRCESTRRLSMRCTPT